MQVVKLSDSINNSLKTKPAVIAMGFFDGVHLGHQEVIKTAKRIADKKGLPLAVLTYDHHPALVYHKLEGNSARYLTVWDRKQKLFQDLGVDLVYQVNYNYQFQSQKPQQFVDDFLLKLNPQTVVAGFDHTYGAKNASMTDLPNYAKNRFKIVTVPADKLDRKKISSTRIRRNLEAGHIETANQLLGYRFETSGTVVHGFARGRTLGFPTANIEYSNLQQMPVEGVYVVRIMVGQHWYAGMASIGRNVTFGDQNPITLEINIFDFNQNIYGNHVQVQWLSKMRNEVKYNGKEALIKQLKQDELDAREFIKLNC